MNENADFDATLRIPRGVIPVELPGIIPLLQEQPFGQVSPNIGTAQSDPSTWGGNILYVMGSSRDGSISPTTWNAPPASSAAQTDTFYSWAPPLLKPVTIIAVTAGVTTSIQATAHGIPATGGPYAVFIAGVTGLTPAINGFQLATRVDADHFTIPVHTTGTATLTAATVAVQTNGVQFWNAARLYLSTTECVWSFTDNSLNVRKYQGKLYNVFKRSTSLYTNGIFIVSAETQDVDLSWNTFAGT